MDRQTLNIQAIKRSWLQKSSIWTISVVNGETFRFSEEDSGEHFECSLESIEKYTRLVSIPFLPYAKILLKIPKKNTFLKLQNLQFHYGKQCRVLQQNKA